MPRSESTLRAYLELLRLPNVFTAIADVMMGYWFVTWSPLRKELPPANTGILLLLVCSTSCLYLAGMVLNDYFDRSKDTRERPTRPIPSRRVPESAALWMGSEFIILGVALAWLVSFFAATPLTGLTAFLLAGAVIFYDGYFKKTSFGPIGMGLCRMLNVLMGMTAAGGGPLSWQTVHYLVAGGIGMYVVGITWFARTEAVESRRSHLLASLLVMLLGITAIASFPNLLPSNETLVASGINVWYAFWSLIALQIVWRCGRAIYRPAPESVQFAVKTCLLSLIVLDATVIFAVQGQDKALFLLALLIPTLFLGRFIYST